MFKRMFFTLLFRKNWNLRKFEGKKLPKYNYIKVYKIIYKILYNLIASLFFYKKLQK